MELKLSDDKIHRERRQVLIVPFMELKQKMLTRFQWWMIVLIVPFMELKQ